MVFEQDSKGFFKVEVRGGSIADMKDDWCISTLTSGQSIVFEEERRKREKREVTVTKLLCNFGYII